MSRIVTRRWLLIVLGVGIAGLLGTRWWFRAPAGLNILLITLDTTRADRLGAWGGPGHLTPHLDELAARGVVFERAYAPVPITLPSHASMMTGLYPPEHGLRVNNGVNRLSSDVPVLAELLRQQGYRTGAFIGAFVLDKRFGLDRGFEVYDDRMEEAHGPTAGDPHGHKTRVGQHVVDAALSWLGKHRHESALCWIHLFDPHTPYNPRRELFGDRFVDEPYDAGIAYVDLQIGRVLDSLRKSGVIDRTLVVVVGDHGESLGEHQERSHGFTLYESTVHVPWIMAWPGEKPPVRRISTPVSLADLFPTLLAVAGYRDQVDCSGRSLLEACHGSDVPSRDLYVESNHGFEECGAAPLRSLIADRWKYIRSPRPELYDLLADPKELTNLADQKSDLLQDFELRLQERESELTLREAPSIAISPHDQRKLASLGYVGESHAKRVDESNLPDIKDLLPQYNAYTDGQMLMGGGRFTEAAQVLENVGRAAPHFFQAWYNLGFCRERLGDLPGAEAAYLHAVQIDGNATAQIALAGAYLQQHQPEKAIAPLEIAVRLQPELPRGAFLLGEAYRLLKRWKEARQSYQAALKADPEFAPAWDSLERLPAE